MARNRIRKEGQKKGNCTVCRSRDHLRWIRYGRVANPEWEDSYKDRFFLLNPSNEMKVKESWRLAVAFIRGIRRSRDKMIKT